MSTLGPDVHTRAKIPPLRRPRANRPTSKLLRRTLLDGLFHYVAQEEAAIRKDPAKRTTKILRRVFGAS